LLGSSFTSILDRKPPSFTICQPCRRPNTLPYRRRKKSRTATSLPGPQTQQEMSPSVEQLGGKTIAGVYAEGTRTTEVDSRRYSRQ
jgi:hypothetical protein